MHIGLQFKAFGYSIGRLFGPVTITDWYGIKMRVYPFEQAPIKKLITRENYKYEFSMYKKYAKGVVLDIGANIGIHSVYLSRFAEKVYAFEPVPDTFERLRETVHLNNVTNVVPVHSAVGDRDGLATIYIFEKAYSSWNSFSIPDADKKSSETEKVPITTLDTFAEKEKIEKIDFLKIDVEGFELSVLKGASTLLSQHIIHALSFEVTRMHSKNAEAIFELLRSHGYLVDNYDPTKTHHNYYAVLKEQAL